MMFQKIILFFLFFFTITILGYSQNPALSKISKDDMMRHLTFIASDSLQGRNFNTEINGLEIAADYIAGTIKDLGLKPGGENYFQKVNLESSKSDNRNTYLVIYNDDELILKADSVLNLQRNISNIEFGGEIIFAGFGWEDKDSNYNDFTGVDLRNKIVVYSAGTPELFRKEEIYRWNNRLEISKRDRAFKAGAAGVILINNPHDARVENSNYNTVSRYINRSGYTLKKKTNQQNNKGFVLTTTTVADNLLGGKGEFEKYLHQIAKKSEPNSFLVKKATSNIRVSKKVQSIDAKNIIGIVEGSDPELKKECVVFMAHYDHLGIGNDGDVYNGADDNGSGTVTLMELAKAFSCLEKKPKRSILFLWVTAEEIGLLGSQYYSENPLISLEKTVACINLDMVGRVYEPRDSVWNKSPKKVKDFNGLYMLSNNIWDELSAISDAKCAKLSIIPDKSLPANFLRSSDHYHFHNKGVPVINYATGYHADYHKVGDEVSKINFDKMKLVADLCFLVGFEIANLDKIESKK